VAGGGLPLLEVVDVVSDAIVDWLVEFGGVYEGYGLGKMTEWFDDDVWVVCGSGM